MRKASIAVVIVSYNRENYLKQLLDSLLEQDDKESFELIILDNGSRNPLEPVISDELARFRGQVTLLREHTNLLSPVRLLQAISIVESDFILLPGDDDVALPNYISTMRALANSGESVNMISSAIQNIDVNGKKIGGVWHPAHFSSQQEAIAGLLETCCYPMPSSGFRKDAIDLSLIPRTRTATDWSLWLNSWVLGRAAVSDVETVQYRNHSGQEQHFYSRQRFNLDAARVLTEFVTSDRFDKMLRSWKSSEVTNFVNYLLESKGINGGETRWGPLVQILIADKIVDIGFDSLAVALHAQASAQAGVIPDVGTLKALAADPSLGRIPAETWTRIPVTAVWNYHCDFTRAWREYLNMPNVKSAKIDVLAECSCHGQETVAHELSFHISRDEFGLKRDLRLFDYPSAAASFDFMEALGIMTGREAGFEITARNQKRIRGIAGRLKRSKFGMSLFKIWPRLKTSKI